MNGINTHGETNVDLLGSDLARYGCPIVDVRLPKRHWMSARWGGPADAQLVKKSSKDGDALIAHSFGAIRAWYAHKMTEYKYLFIIAPAHGHMVKWRVPERVHCFHSDGDWTVKLGASLPFHPFGWAGVVGYQQRGVVNVDCTSDHGGYFSDPHLRRHIVDYILEVTESD